MSHCLNLRRVTIAHSEETTILQAKIAPRLESFCYYNDFLPDGFVLQVSDVLSYIFASRKSFKEPKSVRQTMLCTP